MDLLNIVIILIVGLIAGFLNVVAGGGSLLTMPTLIFLGLPSAVANGTNRIALMVQNIVAIFNFKKGGYFDWKIGLMLGIPALFGSIIGANIAIALSDELFNKILAVVMIIVLIFTIWQPQKKVNNDNENISLKKKILSIIIFFFIGFYGGFIQAGVGFFIIFALTMVTGMSLIKINSIKVFVIFVYTFASLAIFVFNGQVDWTMGLTLAIGNGIGAWLGAKFSINKGDKWIKLVLVITVSIMAIKLFIN